MKFDHRGVWLDRFYWTAGGGAALVMVLCLGAPASAEEFLLETPDGLLAFQSDQDRQSYIQWVREGGRSLWLYSSDRLMKPCGEARMRCANRTWSTSARSTQSR